MYRVREFVLFKTFIDEEGPIGFTLLGFRVIFHSLDFARYRIIAGWDVHERYGFPLAR